jgi:hypothetical protein
MLGVFVVYCISPSSSLECGVILENTGCGDGNCGVVYPVLPILHISSLSSHGQHFREIARSGRSFRKHSPSNKVKIAIISIFTKKEIIEFTRRIPHLNHVEANEYEGWYGEGALGTQGIDVSEELDLLVTDWIQIKSDTVPAGGFLTKIDSLYYIPFQKALMVDTDTTFTADIEPLFDLLQWYDIGMVPEYNQESINYRSIFKASEYDEQLYNSGVMLVRGGSKSGCVRDFVETWQREYSIHCLNFKRGTVWDQCALHHAIRKTKNLKFATLSARFNVRARSRFVRSHDTFIMHARKFPKCVHTVTACLEDQTSNTT